MHRPLWLKTILEPRKTAFYGRFYIHSKRATPQGDWCCWPDVPQRPHLAWKIARLCGLRLVGRPTPDARLGLLFADATSQDPPGPGELPAGVATINERCLDIGKHRVEAAHRRAFGYGMAVDPTTHSGPMVVKSNTNAAHDGRVVQGPLATTEPGSVYQIEIDNHVDEVGGRAVRAPTVLDLRITVVGGEITGAFRKYRSASVRFLNTNDRAFFHAPSELFSEQEQRQLLTFEMCIRDSIRDVRQGPDGFLYVLTDERNGKLIRIVPE